MPLPVPNFLCQCKAVATCEAEEAAQVFCSIPGVFTWPKVCAGGELSTDCHCGSEDSSVSGGCGADKPSTSESGCAHPPHYALSLDPSGQVSRSVECNSCRTNVQPRQSGPQPSVHGVVTRGPWPSRRRGGADGHAWAVPWMDTIHHPACLFSLSLPIRVELLTEVEMQRAERPIAEHPPPQSRHFATENTSGEKTPRTASLQQNFLKQEARGSGIGVARGQDRAEGERGGSRGDAHRVMLAG